MARLIGYLTRSAIHAVNDNGEPIPSTTRETLIGVTTLAAQGNRTTPIKVMAALKTAQCYY
jgi:hypothetical protein